MIRPFITLTGVDVGTNLSALKKLVVPGVEFGVLVTVSPEGRNRYPDMPTIQRIVGVLGRQCAVHICGKATRAFVCHGAFKGVFNRVGRMQVNGLVTEAELAQFIDLFPGQEIITQYGQGTGNRDLAQAQTCGRHSIVMDSSGGRGKRPRRWSVPSPATIKSVGFAGGLGPDNLGKQLQRICSIARPGWWIDMESKVRNENDWFCLERVQRCIEIAKNTCPHRFVESDHSDSA